MWVRWQVEEEGVGVGEKKEPGAGGAGVEGGDASVGTEGGASESRSMPALAERVRGLEASVGQGVQAVLGPGLQKIAEGGVWVGSMGGGARAVSGQAQDVSR